MSTGAPVRPVPSKTGSAAPLRVILVGRTGLDQSLRREPGIELVRTRGCLEAIGEAGEPAQEHAITCVLVAPDADPGADAPRFVTGVRAVDPRARVMLIDDGTPRASARAYDALVPSGASLTQIRAASVAPARPPASAEPPPPARSAQFSTLIVGPMPVFGSTPRPPAQPTQAEPGSASGSNTIAQVSAKQPSITPSLPTFTPPPVLGADLSPPRGARSEPGSPGERTTSSAKAPTAARAPMSPIAPTNTSSAASNPSTPVGAGREPGAAASAASVPAAPALAGVSVAAQLKQPVRVEMPGAIGEVLGDGELVSATMSGRDLAPLVAAALRARLGVADIAIVSAIDVPPGGVAIEHRGRVLGYLVSGTLGPRELSEHAPWAGAWLALHQHHEALKRAALTDELTGAYNRRYFQGFVREAIEQAQRQRGTLTVMVFDLDNFKKFNDAHGHGAGDEILKETVNLLQSVIREHDRVCRIGGDEFVVVFTEPTGPRDPGSKPPTDVHPIAQRFQQQIKAHKFPKLAQCAPGDLSISGGLATYPWDGRSAEELLQYADERALESKRAGKNCLCIGPGVLM